MTYHSPSHQPDYLSLRDLWREMEDSSPHETLGSFMQNLALRNIVYGGTTKDVVYDTTDMMRCRECSALELDRPITDGLCEECLCEQEHEYRLEADHIQGLASWYSVSRGV